MKRFRLLLISVLVLIGVYMLGYNTPHPRPLELVSVDGDEMPGIGSDNPNKPDTAVLYVNKADQSIHIRYTR